MITTRGSSRAKSLGKIFLSYSKISLSTFFLTPNTFRNSYRQRNVFLYPPQLPSKCNIFENLVVGDGECGINGNTKVFQAGKLY